MTMPELVDWLKTSLSTLSPQGEFQRGYQLALVDVLSKVDSLVGVETPLTPDASIEYPVYDQLETQNA